MSRRTPSGSFATRSRVRSRTPGSSSTFGKRASVWRLARLRCVERHENEARHNPWDHPGRSINSARSGALVSGPNGVNPTIYLASAESEKFQPLRRTTFSAHGIGETAHLHKWILAEPNVLGE